MSRTISSFSTFFPPPFKSVVGSELLQVLWKSSEETDLVSGDLQKDREKHSLKYNIKRKKRIKAGWNLFSYSSESISFTDSKESTKDYTVVTNLLKTKVKLLLLMKDNVHNYYRANTNPNHSQGIQSRTRSILLTLTFAYAKINSKHLYICLTGARWHTLGTERTGRSTHQATFHPLP